MFHLSKMNMQKPTIAYCHIDDKNPEPYVSFLDDALNKISNYYTPGPLNRISLSAAHYSKITQKECIIVPLSKNKPYSISDLAADYYIPPISVGEVWFR